MSKVFIPVYILCLALYFMLAFQDIGTAMIFGIGGNFIFWTGIKILEKDGAGRKTILIYSLGFFLSSAFIFLNYLHFYDFSNSTLSLTKDALLYHELASQIANTQGLDNISINFIGYPLLLAILYFLFGDNFILGLLLNLLAFVLSLVYLRKLVLMIFHAEYEKEKLASYAMALFLLVPYIVRNSTLLIKDSIIVFSLLLVIVKIIQFKFFKFNKGDFLKLAVGIILIGLLRAPYLFIIPLIFLVTVGVSNFKSIILMLVAFLVTGAIMIFSFQYSTHELNAENLAETYIVRDGAAKDVGNSTVYRLIGGDYKNKGVIEKLKILPITTGMQVLLPFPFTAAGGQDVPPISIYSVKMNFIWYFVFVLIIFYFIFLRKQHSNKLLNKIMLLGGVLYLIPAFTEGGITPRYATPFIAILLVGASYSFFMIRNNRFYFKRLPILIIPPTIIFVILFLLLKV